MNKLDPSCYLYIDALRDGYYAERVTFTDPDGNTWAGVAWKNKAWEGKFIVDKGQNESNQTDTNGTDHTYIEPT